MQCLANTTKGNKCSRPAELGRLCFEHGRAYGFLEVREEGIREGRRKVQEMPLRLREAARILEERVHEQDQRRRLQEGRVYYFQSTETGLIKIGKSIQPKRRVYALRPGRLLATEPGGYRVERIRHRQLAESRVKGEWFKPTRRLRRHIRKLQLGRAIGVEPGRGLLSGHQPVHP